MIRGTTPTLEFKLQFDVELIEVASIAFGQGPMMKFEKTLDDCRKEGQMLVLKLSQEDTLKLRSDKKTEIQVRVRLHDGDALASDIITVDTKRILKDGEI